MSDFAAGFQAGLAGVQQFQKIREDKENREKKKAAEAERIKILGEKPTTMGEQATADLAGIKTDSGQQVYRQTQGGEYEALNPATGQYETVAGLGAAVKNQPNKTMFLGKTYDQPLTAEQETGLRNDAIYTSMMKYDPEAAGKFAKGLADIESTKAQAGLAGAQTKKLDIETSYIPKEMEQKFQLTGAQINNINARTQNITDQLKLDYEKFGFTKESFEKEFGQRTAEFLAKNDQFFAQLDLDDRRLTETIANNLRVDARGNRGLDLEGRRVGIAEDMANLDWRKFEHNTLMDVLNQGRADAELELNIARNNSLNAVNDAQAKYYAAQTAEAEQKLATLNRTEAGVNLSYLSDSFKTGDMENANAMLDQYRGDIKQAIKPPKGAENFDDMNIVDRDEYAMTVEFVDAEGKPLGRRVMMFDQLENTADMLQGKTPDMSRQLITYRASLQRGLADLNPESPEYNDALRQLQSVDARLEKELKDSGSAMTLEEIKVRSKYRPLNDENSATVDRLTGQVTATIMGKVMTFPDQAAYNEAKRRGATGVIQQTMGADQRGLR